MFILFPTQLFRNFSLLKNKQVYIVEEPYYFTRLKFHKLKIAFHRATMKKYFDDLISKNINVKYIPFYKVKDFYKKHKNKNAEIYHPIDLPLLNNIKKQFQLTIHPTLNMTFTHLDTDEYFNIAFKNNNFSHHEFYKHQRIKLDILMKENKPIKNKWSFDEQNRYTFPDNIDIPHIGRNRTNDYIQKAIQYTNKHFNNNYGSLEHFIYPISLSEARRWLRQFLKERLNNFGKYQDAVHSNIPFGFHSLLSPLMNVGLLTDMEVINISDKYYNNNKKHIRLPSYEGFIRQIIGWRNFVYLVYLTKGTQMYNQNFLNHRRQLGNKYKQLWEGTTEMPVINDIIHKIVKYGYAHHIERLMYLGNYLLINQFHPKQVYKLFMEWNIDSYDWVMIPNVFGMSQYSDGGIMMTRMYFSSSNYIANMSNYTRRKNEDWWVIWDAIYYHFINRHQNILRSNYATSRQVAHWDRKSNKDKNDTIALAQKYI